MECHRLGGPKKLTNPAGLCDDVLDLIELSCLLVDHHDAVEADLATYPRDADQIDAFWRGEMSWRRLRVLVSQLSRDSATAAATHGADVVAWTPEVELLAQLLEHVRQKPIPRPEE